MIVIHEGIINFVLHFKNHPTDNFAETIVKNASWEGKQINSVSESNIEGKTKRTGDAISISDLSSV